MNREKETVKAGEISTLDPRFWLFRFRTIIHLPVYPLPFLSTRHRASFRNIIPFPAAQGLTAEVAAGGRTGVVDGTAPLPHPFFVRLFLAQVPARDIGKEHAICFFKTPFTEVMQLVGFALVHRYKGEPAAALPTAAAGAGCGGRSGGFHYHHRL
jgi:hypothetical protein